jgi:O-antigen/teichoic acid export membrane protein
MMADAPERGVGGWMQETTIAPHDRHHGGLRGAALRGLVWTFAQAWGTRLVSIAVFAILGRELDAGAFGVMALAVAVVEFGQLLVDQGLSRSIVQRTTIDDSDLDTAFWTALACGALLTLVGVALAAPVANVFDEPQLTPVLRVLSLSFLLTSLSTTQMAILQRELKFRGLAIRRVSSVMVGGLVGVVLAVGGAGVWALVAQNLVQSSAAVAVLWGVSPWRPRGRFSPSKLREMASFGSIALVIELVSYFARRGNDLLIGAFLGPVSLGFFNVAYRILLIIVEVLTSTINAVAFPVFSRLQANPRRMRRALHSAARGSSALAFPAFLALALLAPEIVHTMFGDGWAPSVDVLRVLALSGVAQSVTYFNRSLLLAIGRPGLDLAWVSVVVLTKIVAFAIGYHWGIEGIAWATVVHGVLLAPFGIYVVDRATPIDPRGFARQLAGPLLASSAMVAIALPVRLLVADHVGDLATIGIVGATCAVVYGVLLYVFAPMTVDELLDYMPVRGPLGRLQPSD